MTENPEIFTTSLKPSDKSDAEEESTIGQTAKKIASTTVPVSLSAQPSTSVTIIGESDDANEENNSTATSITSTIEIIDDSRIGMQNHDNASTVGDESDESYEESTLKNAHIERTTVTGSTDGPTTTVDSIDESDSEESTKESEIFSSSTSVSLVKPNDRIRGVSRDEIESTRGRALNLTSFERKPSTSGVIYVTAPPAVIISKTSKAFGGDLSDVSMENDGMDIHSSEYGVTMSPKPIRTDVSECKSKV